MESVLLKRIANEFSEEEVDKVVSMLKQLTLQHVMKASEYNLLNARMSILTLAAGDVSKVQNFVDCAKIDFRDVIYWTSKEYKD